MSRDTVPEVGLTASEKVLMNQINAQAAEIEALKKKVEDTKRQRDVYRKTLGAL